VTADRRSDSNEQVPYAGRLNATLQAFRALEHGVCRGLGNIMARSTLLKNFFCDKTLQTGNGAAESVQRVTISYESSKTIRHSIC